MTDYITESIPTEQPRLTLWKRAKAAVFKNFLPICLVCFVALGITVPQPGVFFSELPTQYVCVVGIFFHSGLKLKTAEVRDALKSFKALLWGIICILLITPIIGGELTGLLPYQPYTSKENSTKDSGNLSSNAAPTPADDLSGDNPLLGPTLFQIGIQIYLIVPCTISSGIILVSYHKVLCNIVYAICLA